MEFQIIHVQYPLWYRVGVFTTIVLLFVGPLLARRNRRLLLVAALPVFVSLLAASIGFRQVAQGMSLTGGGRLALAAGSAEALSVLMFGFLASAIVTAIVTFLARPPIVAVETSFAWWIATTCLLLLQFGFAWFAVQPGQSFSEIFMNIITIGIAASALVLTVAMFEVMRGFAGERSGNLSRSASAGFTVGFGMAGVLVAVIVKVLRGIALGL